MHRSLYTNDLHEWCALHQRLLIITSCHICFILDNLVLVCPQNTLLKQYHFVIVSACWHAQANTTIHNSLLVNYQVFVLLSLQMTHLMAILC